MTSLIRTPKPKPKAAPTFAEQARALLNPSIAGATAAINARTNTGTQAIGGYTENLAHALMGGPEQAQAAYAPSITGTAAVESALANRLSGGGEQLSNDLSTRLSAINAPGATDPALASVRQAGVGAGNASFGRGAASIEALLGNQASAQGYAQKLPGIARLGGLQQIGGLQGQAQQSIADKTAELLGQLPTLVQNLRSQAESTRQFGVSRADRKREFDTQRRDALNAGKSKNAATVTVAKIKAQTAQEAAAAKSAHTNFNERIAFAKTYKYDPVTGKPLPGFKVGANGAVEPKGKAGAKGGLTAGQRAQLRKTAAKTADTFYYGVNPKQRYDTTTGEYTEVPGTGVSGIDYGVALKRLMSQYSLTRAEAETLLNDYYAPGERGRPVVTPKASPDVGFRGVKIPKGK